MKICWRCGEMMLYLQKFNCHRCPKCGRQTDHGPISTIKSGPVQQDWWDEEHLPEEKNERKLPSMKKRIEKLRKEYLKERKKKKD